MQYSSIHERILAYIRAGDCTHVNVQEIEYRVIPSLQNL